MLRTTDNDDLSTQSDQNEKNQDILDSSAGSASANVVSRSIKNLSTIG